MQCSRRYKGIVAVPLVTGLGGAWVAGALGFGAMGISIGFMMGSMLGSYLFPTKAESVKPMVGSYPIQTADKGGAIPIIYGKRKIAGNIIWLGDLTPYQHRVA